MLISSSVFLFLDSSGVALHDSWFKGIIIPVVLGLGARAQFFHCLKQAVLAPFLPPFNTNFC